MEKVSSSGWSSALAGGADDRARLVGDPRSLVEIREGLTAGDRVVVRGNEALQGGQRVQLRGER